jgi:hypothetical protein
MQRLKAFKVGLSFPLQRSTSTIFVADTSLMAQVKAGGTSCQEGMLPR